MGDINVVEDNFGIFEDSSRQKSTKINVKRFTLTNQTGLSVQVITFGATLTSIKVPDKDGRVEDVILGFDDMEGYLGQKGENPYFGATIGRVTNRVANASFLLDGHEVMLTDNAGVAEAVGRQKMHKHGGFFGFDKRVWTAHVIPGKGVTMSYISKDGDEGYPGDLLVSVTYELIPGLNELSIKFKAMTTKRTPVSLTSNPNFNLSGHKQADNGLAGHLVQINADTFTKVDDNFMPTGEIASVVGTEFDFRTKKNLADLLKKFPHCYNHNFCINGPSSSSDKPRLAARVEEEKNGRTLEIFTNQPGIQFYTSAFLPAQTQKPHDTQGKGGGLSGKACAHYFKNGAFCLQSQNYPNAVNQPNFPDPILNPGDIHVHRILLRFSVQNELQNN